MTRYFISGCNRGIGLGLTKEALKNGHFVYGSCRNPDGERDLWELETDYEDQFKILKMDVTDESSIEDAFKEVEAVDVLVNNAGVLEDYQEGISSLNFDLLEKSFNVNSIGPLRVTKHCLKALEKSPLPKVLSISSELGSISENASGNGYGYRASKTALNMLKKNMALEFPKMVCCVIHPGWVKTRMGGDNAPTTVEESCKGIYKLCQELDLKDSGGFFNFKGEERPW